MKLIICFFLSFLFLASSTLSFAIICEEDNGGIIMWVNETLSEENKTLIDLSLMEDPDLENCTYIESYNPCDCVIIEGKAYNSTESTKLIYHYKNLAENPNPDDCNFIIQSQNASIRNWEGKYKKARILIIVLSFIIVVLIIKVFKKKSK